ncbi:hypothetical protein J437_LFUL013733 [Ladona fulva]|uniref:Uncharacterized protein n=1 Tax=Ladona fulva TaxID=123851 RepID=A0A8K0P7Y1_LADFU|nr:hypothetical protein J437_LFUL013733 [Ladona fulva]
MMRLMTGVEKILQGFHYERTPRGFKLSSSSANVLSPSAQKDATKLQPHILDDATHIYSSRKLQDTNVQFFIFQAKQRISKNSPSFSPKKMEKDSGENCVLNESESIGDSSEDDDNNTDIYNVSSGERFSESSSEDELELEEPASKKSKGMSYLEDDFLNLLSEETNKFADVYLKSPTMPETAFTNEWFDATADEMRAHLSLCVDGTRYYIHFSIYTGNKKEIPKDVSSSEAVVLELMKRTCAWAIQWTTVFNPYNATAQQESVPTMLKK